MPIFYQQKVNVATALAIWHIQEAEAYFLQQVPLKRDVNHPQKRLQHLAGRYLLTHLFPELPLHEIMIADTRKPFLENEAYHFSISHCGEYAAAIVSRRSRVGVDIENFNDKLLQLRPRYVGDEEWQMAQQAWSIHQQAVNIHDQLILHTVLWSCKEAIFKWYGYGGVDFRKHMRFNGTLHKEGEEWRLGFHFTKELPMQLEVQVRILQHMVLAWVIGDLT